MTSLKLFNIPFDKAIGLIGNVHILLIVSVVFSVAFDFHNVGSSKISLDLYSVVVSIHSLMFLFYQIIHLLIGRMFLNCVNPSNYGFLFLIESIQAYFTVLYFHNPFIENHWKSSGMFLEKLKYTVIAQTYSVYIFLFLSLITCIFLLFSDDEISRKPKQPELSSVLGMSFEKCESVIYWLSFFSFIPTLIALLADCLLVLNVSYFTKPSHEIVVVFMNYVVMVMYQVYILYKDSIKYECVFNTTLAQSFAIPVLFISLLFNSLVYYLIKYRSSPNAESKSNENGCVHVTKKKRKNRKKR
ncbi:hypothetical protein GCK72_001960 [Caenorhabditis remanei]|uniref:Uncharacterized protein n=1 Tax=Caenorhabditis remanei TaxID=31234 RepID=A0A6A5HWE9_CAERE|nr:hypothetical protein GCK72_001960 [Caenorhabditis remanei]KAF1770142.1 hypothetical protein GCK72_001960 [Caenorhabditis remanei]